MRVYHGPSATERNAALQYVLLRGGVLITTYTTAARAAYELGALRCRCMLSCQCGCECHTSTSGNTRWDWVVLDEGHKVRDTPAFRVCMSCTGCSHLWYARVRVLCWVRPSSRAD